MKGTIVDDKVTVELVSDDLPLKHQVGKMAVGSVASFAANILAEKAYDAALRWHRARKGH